MIKLGIIVIASSTMALSSAIMQDEQDQASPQPKQIIIDKIPTSATAALADPLRRSRSLYTKPITRELIEDCLEVAREVKPQLAMWLEKLQKNSSKEEFEHAIGRNARYLLGLVELRDRNPILYDLKMRELKTGAEIKDVSKLLQQAIDTQSVDQAEMLKVRLRELVRMQASYSIESRGRTLLRIKEHAALLEQQINEQAISFEQTVQQQIDEILLKINSKSSSQSRNSSTSG